MKKLIFLALALMLALTLLICAIAENGPAGDPPEGLSSKTIGTLSLLNMTEEEYAVFVGIRIRNGDQLLREGYVRAQEGGPDALAEGGPQGEPPEGAPQGEPPEGAPEEAPQGEPPEGAPEGPMQEGNADKVVYYDTLDALLMALNAGDIDSIEIFQSVARYLCANNDNLRMGVSYDTDKPLNAFAKLVQKGVTGNDFSFLMMESSAALRDEFDAAIADMKADGTLERLVREQIDALIDGGEISPVELPRFDDAETIRVAVTGSLPPMDYVAADGTPAGFNTAVLAEIGQRTGKNIELVVVDSLGRAAALASGTVDAVFWTRTSSTLMDAAAMTEEEKQTYMAKVEAELTEEEARLLRASKESADILSYGTADMPESTIITDSYFSDVCVPVELAGGERQ